MLRLNPNDAMALEGRGLALLNKQEYESVIADMTEALRLNPRLARAYSCRGAALASKKEYERALADFDEAIEATRTTSRPTEARRRLGDLSRWALSRREKRSHPRRSPASCTNGPAPIAWTRWPPLTPRPGNSTRRSIGRGRHWRSCRVTIETGNHSARLTLYQARKPCRGESSGPDNALAVSPPPRNSGDRSRPNETRGSSSASTR